MQSETDNDRGYFADVEESTELLLPNQEIKPASAFTQAQLKKIMDDGWKLTPATCAHKITNGRWIPAKHLLYISNIIAPAIAKGGARIILSMPPRHGKSEFISVNTPIWFLENWPHKHVMGVSYGADLAEDFAYKVRTAFLDEELEHLLTTRLLKNKMRVNRFLTTEGGGMTAAGIGGVLTGRGGDLILVDDYIKNAEQALSDGQKESIFEWFKSTLFTRQEPNASIIILATRWAEDDLIGRVIEDMPDENWIVVHLPALAMENDPLGREVDEPLWPERYDKKTLTSFKNGVGKFWWSALYQQDPLSSMSGQELGDLLRVRDKEDIPNYEALVKMRIWDFAATLGGGDWTVGILMGIDLETKIVFILGVERHQLSSAQIDLLVRNTALVDGAGIEVYQEQEPGSAGKSQYEHMRDGPLRGFTHSAEKPTGKIEVRAMGFLAGVECGAVVCVNGPWVEKLRKELNGWPDPKHDDQISAGALGYNKLIAKIRNTSGTWGRKRNVNSGGVRVRRTHENTNKVGLTGTHGNTWGNR